MLLDQSTNQSITREIVLPLTSLNPSPWAPARQSMSDMLRRRKRLTEGEVQYYLLQLLDALAHLHARGVIHRYDVVMSRDGRKQEREGGGRDEKHVCACRKRASGERASKHSLHRRSPPSPSHTTTTPPRRRRKQGPEARKPLPGQAHAHQGMSLLMLMLHPSIHPCPHTHPSTPTHTHTHTLTHTHHTRIDLPTLIHTPLSLS